MLRVVWSRGRAEPLQEMSVDAPAHAGPRLGVGNPRRRRDAVGPNETRPLRQGADLTGGQVGLVFAEETRTARDQDATAVEAAHVAGDDGARKTGSRGYLTS